MKITKLTSLIDLKLILLFCTAGIIFGAITMFGTSQTLDMKMYYSGEEGRAFLAKMTNEEIRAYVFSAWLDWALVLTYTAAMCRLFSKLCQTQKYFLVFAVLPGLCDLIETSGVLYIIAFGGSNEILNWLGAVTFCKWAAWFFAIVVIGYLAVRFDRSSRD